MSPKKLLFSLGLSTIIKTSLGKICKRDNGQDRVFAQSVKLMGKITTICSITVASSSRYGGNYRLILASVL